MSQPLSNEQKATTIVIFGASGDLTRRKLVPALFSLCRKERLPADCNIVGFAWTKWNTTEFRRRMRSGVDEFAQLEFSESDWETFVNRLHYVSGSFTDLEDYSVLQESLHELEGKSADRLYYLATPPRFFAEIVAYLDAAGMNEKAKDLETNWRRVVIEKPFGRDLASAQELNRAIHRILDERQIFRIDHYLAKETVQNILVFRFGNTMFEPIWSRSFIDHVQITVAETVDVEHRAGYYDQAGVLRDMFQNHLMQLLALGRRKRPGRGEGSSGLRFDLI